MKIVRIIARLNVGGPARHVVWLTRNLQNEEFSSVLLTGRVPVGEEDMSWFSAENGVEPVFIEEMSRELSPKDIISLWKVFRQIVREKPDIIHTHTAKAGTVGRVAGLLYRWLIWKNVKLVHTYHGHVFHSYYGKRKTALFLMIERTLARFSDRIIAISAQQRTEINEQFRVGRADQFRVVRLGIDLEPFRLAEQKRSVLRKEIAAADDEILVGFVGRLTEIKNIQMFLQTAGIFQKTRNADTPKLRFVIVGDGHLRDELEALTDKLGVREVVTFLGNRNDTDVFYAGLDLIALTSFNEGTPLSIIEAMANAKPFVATKVGGVVDLLGEIARDSAGIEIGERGIGVESGDEQALLKGILYLASDRQKRESLGAAGKDFVARHYSKERLTDDIISLYRELREN